MEYGGGGSGSRETWRVGNKSGVWGLTQAKQYGRELGCGCRCGRGRRESWCREVGSGGEEGGREEQGWGRGGGGKDSAFELVVEPNQSGALKCAGVCEVHQDTTLNCYVERWTEKLCRVALLAGAFPKWCFLWMH